MPLTSVSSTFLLLAALLVSQAAPAENVNAMMIAVALAFGSIVGFQTCMLGEHSLMARLLHIALSLAGGAVACFSMANVIVAVG